MRILHTGLAILPVAATAIIFACDPASVTEEVVRLPKPGTTFNPRCGKAGDAVTITVPSGDDLACRSRTVRFHPGAPAAVTSIAPGGGGTCVLTATVPEPARTGTVDVGEQLPPGQGVAGPNGEPSEQVYRSSEDFTVPCPSDAGPDTPIDSDSGTAAAPPLNTIFLHRRFSNSTITNTETATFPQVVTDAQKAAIARQEAIVRSELSPLGVAPGTCAPLALPAAGPDLPSPVYRGPLTVKAGASNVLDGVTCGPDFVYRRSYVHGNFTGSSAWELSFGGNAAEQAFTVPDATSEIPTLDLTTPNPATPDVDVAQGPFTVVWNATLAKLMTIYLIRSSGAPIVCVPDPLAGTFVVPASVIGGPGDVELVVSGGDLRRLAIAQLAAAIMTMQVHNYNFTLHVQ